jgi:hypothetical protein
MADSSTPEPIEALQEASGRPAPQAVIIQEAKVRHREFVGSALGLLIFGAGVGLLILTFKLAFDLFTMPPDKTLGLSTKKVLDFASAGDSAAGLLLRIILLLVMAGVGSMVANRGIALYCGARNHPK